MSQQHQQQQMRGRFLEELSTALFHFILPLLPTPEELALKSQVRTLLERLVRTVEPNCRLLRFGSTANGFSLRNSDMDLCVLLEGEEPRPAAAELVTLIGSLLERETNFAVKALPKAYVPIIKLSLAPSPGLPFGIACDIGFENRLALENTRLLLTYATVDPARVRTMVLFLKVWSKRRKINSPYRGTLSSYGYTLLVLFFLIHIQSPPVLPNLQRIPPTKPVAKEDMELDGHDIWFFDDTESLRKGWSSSNLQSVGELLIDFFRFYCNVFAFNTDVVSIRAGLLTKESKQWTTDSDVGGINEMARDRNRLCIEDPFETSYNVARTVTKDGLYTIRGEFMRASRILTGRPERAVTALAQLCEEERDEDLVRQPRSKSPPGRHNGTGRSPYAFGGGYRQHMGGPVDRLSPPHHNSYLQDSNGIPNGGPAPPLLPASLTPSIPQLPPSHSAPSSRSVSASGGPRRQQWTTSSPARPPVFSPQTSPKVNPHHPSQLYVQSQGLGLDFSIGPPLGGGPSSANESHQQQQQQQMNGGGFDVVRGRGTEARALGSGRSDGTPPGTPPYPPLPPRERSVLGTLSGSGVFGGVPEPDERDRERERISMRGPSVDARGRSGGGRVGDLRLSSGAGSTLGSGLGGGLGGGGGGSSSSSGSSSFARRAVSTPPPMSSSSINHLSLASQQLQHSNSSNNTSPATSSTSTAYESQHLGYINNSDPYHNLPPPSSSNNNSSSSLVNHSNSNNNSYAPFGHPTSSSTHSSTHNLSHLAPSPSSPTYLSPSLLLSPTSGSNEVPHPLISNSARAVGAGMRHGNAAPGRERDSSTSRSRPPPSSRDEAEDLGKLMGEIKLDGGLSGR